ncbi:MAG: hypothetical protein JNL03_01625, partial [Prolixibacteraceae bacterium]|nr:hypothetical protein [Prolixibacteraceae bacterium]
MNKRKLVQIIVKDLEELKILSEEVAEIKGDASLFIELALSKARLLCQEIELLREVSTSKMSEAEETGDEDDNTEEAENADVNISDPELEILNFEHPETQEEEEEEEEEDDDDDDDDETEEEEFQEEKDDENKDDDENPESEENEPEFEVGEAEENEYPEEQEIEEEQSEEDDLQEPEEEEEDEVEEDLNDQNEEEANEDQPEAENETDDQQTVRQPEIREIQIDDMDDDMENIRFTPVSEAADRPFMREIPKPEEPVQEKTVVGESFRKERSVNDAMGENKANESKLANGPITSLRAAIGLNDRFLFIREIFGNNT